jgi:hypothetical protein
MGGGAPDDEIHAQGAGHGRGLFAPKGFRVIAVAQKNNPSAVGSFGVADEKDMVLIGYLIFFDPPKESTPKRSFPLKNMGSRPKSSPAIRPRSRNMFSRSSGLPYQGVLLGKATSRLDGSALKGGGKAQSLRQAFARGQSPGGRALKSNGHVVGYMGDGINDAPALKEADIGISVDTAVDIAKESAHVILLEKDLDRPRRWHHRRPQDLRQHDQIHQDDGFEQLRQHLLRARRRGFFALPADAAAYSFFCSIFSMTFPASPSPSTRR